MDLEDIVAVPLILIVGAIIILTLQGFDVSFLINILDDVIVFAIIVAVTVAILREVID